MVQIHSFTAWVTRKSRSPHEIWTPNLTKLAALGTAGTVTIFSVGKAMLYRKLWMPDVQETRALFSRRKLPNKQMRV
jgi:hypothetical protein